MSSVDERILQLLETEVAHRHEMAKLEREHRERASKRGDDLVAGILSAIPALIETVTKRATIPNDQASAIHDIASHAIAFSASIRQEQSVKLIEILSPPQLDCLLAIRKLAEQVTGGTPATPSNGHGPHLHVVPTEKPAEPS